MVYFFLLPVLSHSSNFINLGSMRQGYHLHHKLTVFQLSNLPVKIQFSNRVLKQKLNRILTKMT